MPGVIGVQMAGGPMATANGEYLRAPGQEILTLRPAAHYDFESGSSIAAANVTGVVALLLQHRAALTSSDVRALLETSAAELTVLDSPPMHSIDACAAVATLVATGRCSQAAPVRTATARDQKNPLSPTK
jgi:subtilisin family serine protease